MLFAQLTMLLKFHVKRQAHLSGNISYLSKHVITINYSRISRRFLAGVNFAVSRPRGLRSHSKDGLAVWLASSWLADCVI